MTERCIPASDASIPDLIQAGQLRAIFGDVSDMWLWRRLKDGTLPPPIVISGRRFWRRDEIKNLIDRRFAQLPTVSAQRPCPAEKIQRLSEEGHGLASESTTGRDKGATG
ncbi:helix-turn-helix transcriptional regulator [Taklimakanibacter deserti]|uniref:helix-turn-helix transcriptional regulator n=1 Tax=Taklimakanibacter deserti TaxID=2267839 RepID=UPI0013C4BF7D